MLPKLLRPAAIFLLLPALALAGAAETAEPHKPRVDWEHLSTRRGEIPMPPGGSVQQTASLIGDFDGDEIDDFVVGFRQKPPALVWYRRMAEGWEAHVIEDEFLRVEAGGATTDIDGDGDLDIVFGGDSSSNELWWWENPSPAFDPEKSWTRRTIKKEGATQHHDQVFGDFLGTGREQLAYWNQRAKILYLAEIPENPKSLDAWPAIEVVSADSTGATPYTEGISAADVDGDGQLDILAYDSWFKHLGGNRFKRIKFADHGGLIFAGRFVEDSKYPQIVVSVGDGRGRAYLYRCTGDPQHPDSWEGHDLAGREVIHGHSLQLGDIDGDGHLDIFLAEMAQWNSEQPGPNHPTATAWIFFGDGQGEFEKTELVVGHGWHEARLADLDGDGDLDILNKPYTWETPRLDVWINRGTGAGS